MRNIISLLLVLGVMISMFGCAANGTANSNKVSFFFLHSDIQYNSDSPVLAEERHVVVDSMQNPAIIIEHYLKGPDSNNCKTPFPSGTTLISCEATNTYVSLVLSQEILSLTAVQQTIAFACITRTVTELTGATEVQIAIADSNEQITENYTFSADSFSYFDSVTINDLDPA